MDGRDRQSRIERMKREKQRQERLRRRQVAILKRCLAVGAVVGVFLLLIVGVWALVKPSGDKKTAQKDNLEAQADNATEEAGAVNPNDEDTSQSTTEETSTEQRQGASGQAINDGPASLKPIANAQTLKYAVPGWQVDTGGWWYANADNTYYENGWATLEGKKYFFNSEGYMQTGWTPIGGKGYFFDEAGQHVADKQNNMIALTFDDGPGKHTERLLDLLKANNAKATFFMVGQNIGGEYGHLVERMIEDGHELGNHTYDHADLTSLNGDDLRWELDKVDEALGQISPGAKTVLTRPPYGANNEEVMEAINMPAVFWNMDTNDWQTRNAEKIVEVVMGTKAGDVILMHDIHQETVDACEMVIPKLIAAGFELVTVDELARANGVVMQEGKAYYGFTEADIAKFNASSGEEGGASSGEASDDGGSEASET